MKSQNFPKSSHTPEFNNQLENKLGTIDEKYRFKVRNILLENRTIFYNPEEPPSKTDIVEPKIETTDHPPTRQKPYRAPFSQRKVIAEQIDKMLTQEIIQPSRSSWSSPVVLAKKKDDTYRFCVDYRKLNNVTLKDNDPLPRVDDIFDHLGASTIFSTLDLDRGFWQIPMADEDKEKTAFTSFAGLCEFNVMPFGLSNAPATFKRLMEQVLHYLKWQNNVFVYMDDVLICSTDIDQPPTRIQPLSSSKLEIKFQKMLFCTIPRQLLGSQSDFQWSETR